MMSAIDRGVLTWVSRPAKDNPRGMALVLGSIALSMVSVGLLTRIWGATQAGAVGWAIAAGAFLTIHLRNFFLPTRYRLDSEGITVAEWLMTRKRPWSRCKSLHEDRFGVVVSPFTSATRLETFRGLFLRFAENREEVMKYCRAHLVANENGSENEKQE